MCNANELSLVAFSSSPVCAGKTFLADSCCCLAGCALKVDNLRQGLAGGKESLESYLVEFLLDSDQHGVACLNLVDGMAVGYIKGDVFCRCLRIDREFVSLDFAIEGAIKGHGNPV